VDVNGDVDQELTRQSLLSFHRNADRALERERRFVRRISPDLLVADADPLAVMAGTSLESHPTSCPTSPGTGYTEVCSRIWKRNGDSWKALIPEELT
jgi:hypothetical protein